MRGFHLVTDLDGTWLAGSKSGRGRLEALLAACPEAVLTFATGRTFASVLEAIAQEDLRPPQHLISDVGTALFHRAPDGSWVEDQAWADRVAAAWDGQVAAGVLAEGLPDSVRPQPGLAPIRRLALQLTGQGGLAAAGTALEEACRIRGLSADVLPSHGLYLDVLPRGVHKGSALAFLQGSRRLPRPIVGCGDSANDFGLLEASDLPLLMKDGVTDPELPSALRDRIHRTKAPGPEGIHLALETFGLLEGGPHGD